MSHAVAATSIAQLPAQSWIWKYHFCSSSLEMIGLLLSVFVLCVAGLNDCNRPADIVFLINDHDSLPGNTFGQIKNLTSSLIEDFDISGTSIRVAVVTYSSGVKEEFSLSRYTTLDEIREAMDRVYHIGGTSTDFQDAIRYITETTFRADWRAVPQILVVIDNHSWKNRGSDLITDMINSGVTFIIVGINLQDGNATSQLVSPPTHEHFFNVTQTYNWTLLTTARNQLAEQICKDIKNRQMTMSTQNITAPAPPVIEEPVDTSWDNKEYICERPAEIVILLQNRARTWQQHYRHLRVFVNHLIWRFDASIENTRFAFVSYANFTREEFPLDKYCSLEEYYAGVNAIEEIDVSSSNLTEGLKFVKDRTFKKARPGVPRILILITGYRYIDDNTFRVAQEMMDSGITIIIVGVGFVNTHYLEDMVSRPLNEHFFKVHPKFDLRLIRNRVAHYTCKAAQPQIFECENEFNRSAEIAFLIPDTRIIDDYDFQRLLNFTKSIIGNFMISSHRVRVAAVTYGAGIREVFPLDKHCTVENAQDAVEIIQKRNGGRSDLHAGIRFVRETTFKDTRPGVPRILIILSEGYPYNWTKTVKRAKKAINDDITVIVVGIGEEGLPDLTDLLSKPTRDHLFTVRFFSDLPDIACRVSHRVNTASEIRPDIPLDVTATPPDVGNESVCSLPVDIAFLLEDSDNFWYRHFRDALNFTRSAIGQFNVGVDNTRVAVLTFGVGARHVYTFDDDQSHNRIQRHLLTIDQYGGRGADLDDGLSSARERFDQLGRPGIPRVLIIVLEGYPYRWEETLEEAKKTIASGVTIIVVGVGFVGIPEVAQLASKPTNEHFFTVHKHSEMMGIKNSVIQQACRGADNL